MQCNMTSSRTAVPKIRPKNPVYGEAVQAAIVRRRLFHLILGANRDCEIRSAGKCGNRRVVTHGNERIG